MPGASNSTGAANNGAGIAGGTSLTSGLASALPAASAATVGDTYYATDTGDVYTCVSATAWLVTKTGRRLPPDANDVLVWALSESAGPFANTGTGGAYSLAAQNSPAVDPNGFFGSSVLCPTGASASALVGTGAGPTLPTSAVSLSLWTRPRAPGLYGRVVECSLSATAWTSPFSSFGLDWNSDGLHLRGFVVTTGTSGSQQFVGVVTPPTLLQWHHVGLTYDGTSLRLYVDGLIVATTAVTGGAVDYGSNGPWQIGNVNSSLSTPNNQSADSWFSDVRVANVVRPASYYANIWGRGMGYGAP